MNKKAPNKLLYTCISFDSCPPIFPNSPSSDFPESPVSGGEVGRPQSGHFRPDAGGLDQRGPKRHHKADDVHNGALQGESHGDYCQP